MYPSSHVDVIPSAKIQNAVLHIRIASHPLHPVDPPQAGGEPLGVYVESRFDCRSMFTCQTQTPLNAFLFSVQPRQTVPVEIASPLLPGSSPIRLCRVLGIFLLVTAEYANGPNVPPDWQWRWGDVERRAAAPSSAQGPFEQE